MKIGIDKVENGYIVVYATREKIFNLLEHALRDIAREALFEFEGKEQYLHGEHYGKIELKIIEEEK